MCCLSKQANAAQKPKGKRAKQQYFAMSAIVKHYDGAFTTLPDAESENTGEFSDCGNLLAPIDG